MITLTESEIKHLATSPDGLTAAMDYHDLQMTQGEPMGFDCSAHQKRYDELKAERDRLKDEWEGVPNQEVFKKFWGEYCHLDEELNDGIKWIGAAKGNKLKEEDELLYLVSFLYDMALGNHVEKDRREDVLNKTEKLLGIK